MAKLSQPFDSNTVPEREDFSPVPPGTYTAMVVASEVKETKKGGEMIVLELDIMDGDHAGRKLFERLNIRNDNAKAVEIAFRTLSEIVKAVGKTTIKDTEELHNKRLHIEVRVDPAKPYEKDGVMQPGSPQNSIKRFLPVSGAVSTPKTIVKTTETVESKTDDKATPPWKKRQQ